MRITRTTIILLILSLSTSAIYSQQIWPSSLLWRITGNGLDKPSYLYGTMHLKDRRLFFFGDSLYKSIEYSSGFAMEIDPGEMLDSLFTQLSDDDNSPLLKNIVAKEKYSKLSKKLEKKLGIPAEKITRKKLIKARQEWLYKSKKQDDMNAMVDLYLYNIAKEQGKWVGGIEDVSDQLGLKNEIGKDLDVNEYLEDLDNEKAGQYLEQMIQVYTTQDLQKLNSMIGDREEKNLAMIKRNIKMARRMDSLARIRNSFFAVGAAHLPGDSGVVRLLEARGFKVEPVYASKKMAPEAYVYKKIEKEWYLYTAEDSAYKVEMPGKPSDIKLYGDELKFKVYADLVNSSAYMTSVLFTSDNSGESTVKRMLESFGAKSYKKLEEKKISHQGMEGTEIISFKDAVYYKVQVLAGFGKAYLIMAAVEKKEHLFNADANRFFKSFTANTSIEAKVKTWSDFSDSTMGFKMSFPGKVTVNRNAAVEEAETFNMATYSALDLANSSYFMLAIAETKKGFFITDDSLIFNAKLDYYRQNNFSIDDFKKIEFGGYPAISFSSQGKSEGLDVVSKLLVISRGNRSYTLIVVAEKGKEDFPEVSRFFRSFSLTPYQTSGWSLQASDNKVFSSWSPSSITKIPLDTAGLVDYELEAKLELAKKEMEYIAHDANTAVNYNISVNFISPYYWVDNDSIFLTEQLSEYYTDTSNYLAKNNPGNFDSLIYLKPVKNGTVTGYEVLVKNASKSYFKKVRVLRNADTAYHVFVMAPFAIISDTNNTRFFENFRFQNENAPTTVFTNKTKIILRDLLSTDSATRENALEAIEKTKFTKVDLPLLHQAFIKNYADDSVAYYSTCEKISNAIEEISDTTTVRFVKENYYNIPKGSKKRIILLNLLAANKTQDAVTELKTILLHDPAINGVANTMVYSLSDSLLLAKQLFPETSVLFADTSFGPGMISLAMQLADSSMIDKSIFVNNGALIKSVAKWQTKKLKVTEDFYAPYSADVINALKTVGDAESVVLLNQYLTAADLDIKENAALALAGLNKPIAPVQVNKIVASPSYRKDFYEKLLKIKKDKQFPVLYLTQVKFAESYLTEFAYNNADDDETEISSFKLLGEQTASYKGAPARYYIFQVTVWYDDSKYNYPAICGPFDLNKADVLVKGDGQMEIFTEEKLPLKNINTFFKKFIKNQTEVTEPSITE